MRRELLLVLLVITVMLSFSVVVFANPYCATPGVYGTCTNNYFCPVTASNVQKTECCLDVTGNCICTLTFSGVCGDAISGGHYGNVGVTPTPCSPVPCQGSFGESTTNTANTSEPYLMRTYAVTQSANSCGTACPYSDGQTQCQYFIDADNDGYGGQQLSGVWVPCTSVPSGQSKNNIDCNDANFNINPGIIESGFLRCTDALDNSCRVSRGLGGFDYNNPLCQISCDSTYQTLLRFSNTTLVDSKVTPVANDYTYYFPLCVQGANLEVQYSSIDAFEDDLLPILRYNSANKQVSMNTSVGGHDGTFYMNTQSCYASSANSCDAPFVAVAGLDSTSAYSNLVHPEVTSPAKLCCLLEEQGITFNNAGMQEKITCNVIADGICPEDFEDANGTRASCTIFEDPDCGGKSTFYTPSTFRSILGFDFNFAEQNYLLEATNSDNAIITVIDEGIVDTTKTFVMSILSDTHANMSETILFFSYAQSAPVVTFDGVVVLDCTFAQNDAPCFIWDQNLFKLTVRHSLSDHTLEVAFSYKSFSLVLLLGLLFAALLPILLIHYSRSGRLGSIVRKSETALAKDIMVARNYIAERLKTGDHPDTIRTTLKRAGWRDHIVEMGIHGVHTRSTLKQLTGYVQACLDLGVKRSDIYAALLSAGWDRTDIDKVFGEITK